MHFIVIGGNGFIGRHFVSHLLAHGHRATIVTRTTVEQHKDGVETLSGGINALCARPDLLEATEGVCHFASSAIPASSYDDPVADLEENLQPMVKLLEVMRDHGNKRILFLSSGGAVYGHPQVVPIPEDHPTNPISPYGIVKLSIEKYLGFYAHQYGFSTAIVRPANPYGPGQGKLGQLGAVSTFMNLLQSGKAATIWGDGSIVRDFVYVEDLCVMLRLILEQNATGTFNCGGGTGTSLNELIATLESETGKCLDVTYQAARTFDPQEIVLDIKRARTALGWEPKTSLSEGIIQILGSEVSCKV